MRRSRAIIEERLSAKERRLKEILKVYLPEDGESEYSYLFALSFDGVSGNEFRRIEAIAAAINLLQASTFVTDDVLDESTTRYDEATTWCEHGTGVAVACGHLMESLAMETIVREARNRFPLQVGFVAEIANRIVMDVYRGQILDVTLSRSTSVSRAVYKRLASFTTGNFFRHIASLGSQLGNRRAVECSALEEFAYCYGMTLQITDDLVDVTANNKFTGKDFAADLRNRRPRLPVIFALKCAAKKDREALLTYLSAKDSNHDLNQIIAILRKCGAFEKCIDVARGYVKKGQAALTILPKGPTRMRSEKFFDDLIQAQLSEWS